jgi:flagellar motor switch protein FliG
MSVYYRYKKTEGGFRSLVELMEQTPLSRLQKMIGVGMIDDPEYTQKALNYLISFDDICRASDPDLNEILKQTNNSKIIAYSFHAESSEMKQKVLKLVPRSIQQDVSLLLETPIALAENKGAQFKIIGITRELERNKVLSIKKIP